MATLTVSTQVCNLALNFLGNYGSVDSIESPQKPVETIFATYWDVARAMALKEVQPHFAIKRAIIAESATDPIFGYSTQYTIPSDCIMVLGIGNVEDQADNTDYSVEGGFIMTDLYDDDDGLSLRYIFDEDDVSKWTPEFCVYMAWYLAYLSCVAITKDIQKFSAMDKIYRQKKVSAACLSSMENKPIRVNRSKFYESRSTLRPQKQYKK
jgi:hypothetical protein